MQVGKVIFSIKVMPFKDKWISGYSQDSEDASYEKSSTLIRWQYRNSKDCLEKGNEWQDLCFERKDNDGALTRKEKALAIFRDKHDRAQTPQWGIGGRMVSSLTSIYCGSRQHCVSVQQSLSIPSTVTLPHT